MVFVNLIHFRMEGRAMEDPFSESAFALWSLERWVHFAASFGMGNELFFFAFWGRLSISFRLFPAHNKMVFDSLNLPISILFRVHSSLLQAHILIGTSVVFDDIDCTEDPSSLLGRQSNDYKTS